MSHFRMPRLWCNCSDGSMTHDGDYGVDYMGIIVLDRNSEPMTFLSSQRGSDNVGDTLHIESRITSRLGQST